MGPIARLRKLRKLVAKYQKLIDEGAGIYACRIGDDTERRIHRLRVVGKHVEGMSTGYWYPVRVSSIRKGW